MKKISVVLLSHNRLELVKRCYPANLEKAGYPIHEVVWVDNGSTDGTRQYMLDLRTDVSVLLPKNLGVAKGFNAGFRVASGDLIASPGIDIMLPDGWLKILVNYFEAVPRTGIAAILWTDPENFKDLIYGEVEAGGRKVIESKACGTQLFAKSLLDEVGYLPEDLGLYGNDDVVWASRVKEAGYLNYYVPGIRSQHLGDLDRELYPEYREFKDRCLFGQGGILR